MCAHGALASTPRSVTPSAGLTSLSLVPLGVGVTRIGFEALAAALPHLLAVTVGLQEAGQVGARGRTLSIAPPPPSLGQLNGLEDSGAPFLPAPAA